MSLSLRIRAGGDGGNMTEVNHVLYLGPDIWCENIKNYFSHNLAMFGAKIW